MFRVAHRSSSGALTIFAASGLHTHVVTGRSQVWVGTGSASSHLRLDYGRSPHAYVKQRLQIQLRLEMMSGVPLETCWAFNERWNNKFCYKVASCWLFLLNHTTMHGSINIKCWAVFKRRAIDLRNWCIWLVDLFECLMMHGLTNPKEELLMWNPIHQTCKKNVRLRHACIRDSWHSENCIFSFCVILAQNNCLVVWCWPSKAL